ncbi:hypothetical protein BsWGS_19228 [Bradybaena similaris]
MEGEGKKEDAPPAYSNDYSPNYGQPTAYGTDYTANHGQPQATYPTQYNPYGYPGPAAPMQTQGNYTNAVVVTQGVPGTILTTTVPDNMGLAIFATFCCFLPLGIFAIMKASDSRSHLARGDISAALITSNESRRLSLIAIGIGVLMIIGIIVAVVVVVVTGVNTRTYYYG